MKPTKFMATFGDKVKKVEIVTPTGAGDVIYISIDNFREGQMVFQARQWNGYMSSNTILTGDDITVIAEIIEDAEES